MLRTQSDQSGKVVMQWISDLRKRIVNGIAGAWATITNGAKFVADRIMSGIEWLKQKHDEFWRYLRLMSDQTGTTLTNWFNNAVNQVRAGFAWFKNLHDQFWQYLHDMSGKSGALLSNWFNTAVHQVRQGLKAAYDFVTSLPKKFYDSLVGLYNFIVSLPGRVTDAIRTLSQWL